jgi:hypothetical protein
MHHLPEMTRHRPRELPALRSSAARGGASTVLKPGRWHEAFTTIARYRAGGTEEGAASIPCDLGACPSWGGGRHFSRAGETGGTTAPRRSWFSVSAANAVVSVRLKPVKAG